MLTYYRISVFFFYIGINYILTILKQHHVTFTEQQRPLQRRGDYFVINLLTTGLAGGPLTELKHNWTVDITRIPGFMKQRSCFKFLVFNDIFLTD